MTTTIMEEPAARPLPRSNSWYWGRGIWVVASFAIAGALAALAEYRAAAGSSALPYALFWIGYAVVLVMSAVTILDRGTPAEALPAIVLGLAVWGMVPKLLRTGYQILYFDEFDHFRILEGLAATGHLQSDSGLLQIGATFPGLEVATSAVARTTGLSLVAVALAMTVFIHIAALMGIYVLIRDMTGRPEAGALSALIYSLNPSWLFFDSQFSYEGFGIAVMIWTMVFVQRALTRSDRSRQWFVNCIIAALLAIALVTIHHVTSIVLASLLALWALIAAWRSHRGTNKARESALTVACLAAVSIIATVWRLTSVGKTLVDYLAPSFRVSQMLSALFGFLGVGSGQATRATLTGGLPAYELVCAYVMIPILFVFFVWSVAGLWRVRKESQTLIFVLVLLGLGYFASLPLVAVRQFSESVHRTWGFSFIGLAPVIAIAVCNHVSGQHVVMVRKKMLWPSRRLKVRHAAAVGVASLLVVAVGCVATGPDKFYRFGGPVIPGGDATAYGTQTTMVASWFAEHTTSRDVLFADRYVGHAIAIASEIQVPIQRYLLQLVFANKLSVGQVKFVQQYRVDYIVIDRRMATRLPPNGFWYGYAEPGAYSKKLLPENNIDRFGCLNWLTAVFATTDYEVFRVNQSLLASQIRVNSPGITRACRSVGVH